MKKLISILLLFVTVVLVGGCADSSLIEDNYSSITSGTTVTETQELPVTAPPIIPPVIEVYGAENEEGATFSEAFHNNPIDQAYETAIEANESFSQLASIVVTFRKYWESEVDAVVMRLLEVLNEDNANSLIKAQRAWKEYMEYNGDFRYSALSFRNWQGDRRTASGLLLGESRTRAMELMEIYYIITGEIEFVFSPE